MIHTFDLIENHNRFRRGMLFLITVIVFAFNTFIPVSAGVSDISRENLLAQHNLIREDNNLNPLAVDDALSVAALNKAVAMLESDCWDHYCPNGVSPWDFFNEAGYLYVFAGENLAEGFINIESLMTAWMNSQTHRENILRPEFTEVGFGIVRGRYQGVDDNTIVVVHFGTPRDQVVLTSNTINILTPVDGTVITELPLEVIGNTQQNASFTINLNGIETNYELTDTEFRILLQDLNLGENNISFSSSDPNTIVDPGNISVLYDELTVQGIQTSGISLDLKSNINMVFVVLIIIIFLGDLFLMYKTNMGGKGTSLNHFHLGLFIILGLVVLSGGVFGNILQGINS
jgi:uncharacterized protein YkwD